LTLRNRKAVISVATRMIRGASVIDVIAGAGLNAADAATGVIDG
jgi:16S rRNA G966 N2-methylase RsmD